MKSRMDSTGTQLTMDNLKIEFCGKGVNAGAASDKILPCYLHSCPPHFNTVEYYDVSEANNKLHDNFYYEHKKTSRII